jgi:hypothetical protein
VASAAEVNNTFKVSITIGDMYSSRLSTVSVVLDVLSKYQTSLVTYSTFDYVNVNQKVQLIGELTTENSGTIRWRADDDAIDLESYLLNSPELIVTQQAIARSGAVL